jgi:hypothetical protein
LLYGGEWFRARWQAGRQTDQPLADNQTTPNPFPIGLALVPLRTPLGVLRGNRLGLFGPDTQFYRSLTGNDRERRA